MKSTIKFLTISVIVFAFTSNTFSQVPNYVPTNGLVGYWPFNGNANDESGNGYNGLITGATLTTDRFGQANNAFAFNGKTVPGTDNTVVQRDEVIQIPGFNYNFGIGFTVSFWSTDDGGIQRRTDNNIDFAVGISGIHLGSIGMVGISNIPDGLWHHYSYTYNGSSIKQYKDGNLISTSNSSGSMSTNTTEMQFGRYIYHGGLTHYFYLNGLLDDIGFWNRALTQEEITQLYTGNSCNASITSSETTICSGSSSVNLTVNLSGASGTSANCFSPKVVGLSNTSFGMNATCSDNNGNLFVAGAYTGNTNFGNITLAGIGGKDVFLVKYNSCGIQQWALRGGSTGNEDYAGVGTKSIATDASGNIFIVGRYNQTFTFYGNNNTSFVAPYTSTSNGNHQDGYLIKLNANGEVLWGATLRGGSNDGFNGVAVDNSGNPIVTGGFNGCCPSTFAVTIYGPNGSLGVSSFGSNYGSGLVVKFDVNGNILWKAAVYNRDTDLSRLAIDGTNNIYLVSAFRSWSNGTAAKFIDANGTNNSLYNPGIGLGFLVKLNSSGIWQWGTSYGNVGDGVGSLTNGTDVAIDENGNPWISGVYRGAPATFYSTSGSTLLLPASTNDIGFIAKYSSSGVPQLVNSLQQSTGSTYFSSIAISNGTVGIAGYFTGNNLGSSDMLFIKYNTNAVFQSVNTGGGTGDDQANSVVSNSTGFVVSGAIGGASVIDGVSLNSAGTFLWNNYFSGVSLNSFLWSTGATTPSINVSPTSTTTYTCTTTTNGVSCTDSVTVVVNNPTIDLGNDVTACGTSTTLTAPTGFDSYLWSNGGTTNATTVTSNGTYTCTVTQGLCSSSDSIDVTLIDATISASDSTICAGTSVTLSASGSSNTACAALPNNLQSGLVGYWPFCGNANDESGNGHHAINSGATLSTDRYGNINSSYSFNGQSYMTVPNIASAGNSPRTFSVWAYFNSVSYTELSNYMISTGTPAQSSAYNLRLYLGKLNIMGYGNDYQNESGTIVSSMAWHHCLIVYDGVNLMFYLDGQFQGSVTASFSTSGQTNYFGKSNHVGNELFLNGQIDDICILNRALTPTEIQQLFTLGQTTYLWSNGATTPTINVSPTTTTTYTCMVTTNGVSCTDSVTVVVNNPTIDLGNDVTACGTSTTLTAPTGFDSYTWSDGSTTNTTTVTSNGTYTCTVTQGGCSVSDTIDVTLIDATITASDSVICAGDTTTLSVSAMGIGAGTSCTGTSQVNYLTWTPIAAIDSYTNIIKEGSLYYLRSQSNVFQSNALIGPWSSMNFNSQIGNTLAGRMLGTDWSNRVIVSTGWNSLYAYNNGAWQDIGLGGFGCGGNFIHKLANNRIIMMKGGYLRDLYISDNNAVSYTNVTNVDNDYWDMIVAPNGNVYACGGSNTPSMTGIIKSTDNGSSFTQINAQLGISFCSGFAKDCSGSIYAIGDNKIFKSVDGNTWSQHATIPTFFTTNPGASYLVIGSNGDYYYWGYSSASQCALFNSSNQGLTWTQVTDFAVPAEDIYNLKEIDGNIVVVTNQGVYAKTLTQTASYTWSPGGATTSTINVTPTSTSTYTCTTTINGVSCTDSVTVVVNNPTIDLGSDITACGTSTTLTAPTGYDSYAWSNGGTTNTTTVTANGTYSCTVTQGGCSASDSIDVTLIYATISASANTVCSGTAVTITASANGLIESSQDTLLVETTSMNMFYPFSYTSTALQSNVNYLLKVYGTVGFAGNIDSQDAAFQYNWFGSPVSPYPFPNASSVWWFVNGSNLIRPTPDIYNPSHIYYFNYTGNGQPLNISWTDSPYSDNSGQLNFALYRLSDNVTTTYLWSNGATNPTINVSPTTTTTYTCTVTTNGVSCSSNYTITVNNSSASTNIVTAFDSFTWLDGNTYTASNNTATYTTTNAAGCDSVISLNLTITQLSASLSLQVFLDGYYTNSSNPAAMTAARYNNLVASGSANPGAASDVDVITVELRSPSNLDVVAYSVSPILQTNGSVQCVFPAGALGGSFYIVVKHRAAIPLWSANPVTLSSSSAFSFANNSSNSYSYGSITPIHTLVPSLFGIWLGELNDDGYLDGLDYPWFENETYSSAYGGLYLLDGDFNGDSYVDASDYAVFDYNSTIGSYEQRPYAITTNVSIGQSYQGGIVAYILQAGDIGYDATMQHGLIAAPSDQGIAQWGCYGTEISGADATAIGTGAQNTIDILNGCSTAGIPARLCGDLVLGGFSDWYLPSKDELNKLYINRVAIGGFGNYGYWSSSEGINFLIAWGLDFSNTYLDCYSKNGLGGARAVRAF